jgi:large subunit ribosomal protein L30
MPNLVVTQVRSSIGAKPKHRGTLRALGLGRIGKSNTLPDRPEIRGMIARVPHMITVDEAAEDAPAKKTAAKKAPANKATTKKATARKTAAKKATAKKATAKKAAAGTAKSEETRES